MNSYPNSGEPDADLEKNNEFQTIDDTENSGGSPAGVGVGVNDAHETSNSAPTPTPTPGSTPIPDSSPGDSPAIAHVKDIL